MAINITDKAAYYVNDQITERGHGLGIRVGVKPSGCTGLSYILEFVDQVLPEDLVFEDSGVKMFVDPKSLVYLDGSELDFVREGLNTGLEFRNPNVSAECGCGESFTV